MRQRKIKTYFSWIYSIGIYKTEDNIIRFITSAVLSHILSIFIYLVREFCN